MAKARRNLLLKTVISLVLLGIIAGALWYGLTYNRRATETEGRRLQEDRIRVVFGTEFELLVQPDTPEGVKEYEQVTKAYRDADRAWWNAYRDLPHEQKTIWVEKRLKAQHEAQNTAGLAKLRWLAAQMQEMTREQPARP